MGWRLEEDTRYFTLRTLLACVRRCFLDQGGNFLRPGYVDRVTGAGDFDLVAVGARGIPPFEVRVDGSVCSRYQHPGWFAFPRSRGDNYLEVVGEIGHLRSRHESGQLRRQVGCEILMKLRWIEVCETVSSLPYRGRFTEVTWESFSVVSLTLSSIWHMGRDVHQSSDRGVRASFGNTAPP